MRHRKHGKILGRKVGPRKALMRILAINLITNEKMVTTEAKAKALRPQIEKMITKARKDNELATRRDLLATLDSRDAVNKLLDDVAPRFKKTPGGYTRIIKLPARQGDGAKMAQIEFTNIPEKIVKKVEKKKSAKKTEAKKEKDTAAKK